MFRRFRLLLWIGVLAALVAAGWVLWRSEDPTYTVQEWLHGRQFSQWDGLIREVAAEEQLDPMLLKAVVWQESVFNPRKAGKAGERGLMQVMEIAAVDWAKATNKKDFAPEHLYDPPTNLRVGAWYLKKALDHWSDRDDPLPFALAEYNAGKSRVDRWIAETNLGAAAKAGDLRERISFPSTRSYVNSILARYYFYRARGRM